MERNRYLNPDPAEAFLQIESTNICNHRCLFCPNSKITAPRRFVERDLAMRIIQEAYDMGVRRAAFFLFGEPLLCPDIFDYYRAAADLGYTMRILVTNLAAADEAMVRAIFASGVTDLKVSINGGPQTYAKVHGRDDYEKVMALLQYAFRYKTENRIPCRILSSFVLNEESREEYRSHASRIRNMVDFFVTTNMTGFVGSVEEETAALHPEMSTDQLPYLFDTKRSVPCSELQERICVTVDGFLSLCCQEPFGRAHICDLHDTPLRDAWFSEKMQEIRHRHHDRDVQDLLCRNCIAAKSLC